jgi:hypothetical protein
MTPVEQGPATNSSIPPKRKELRATCTGLGRATELSGTDTPGSQKMENMLQWAEVVASNI